MRVGELLHVPQLHVSNGIPGRFCGGRHVPTGMLYGTVVEYVDMSG